ncbi:hypothetical protein SUSAZ_10390 [Sulfolobus acidocaldarius SUSAZ]|nr:hypothetical protein SUSAZ_10390 [Sulfolobus acidocaldarius SUSAZ]
MGEENKLLFPSKEWAKEFCKSLNQNKQFLEGAKNIKWNSILFVGIDAPQNVRAAVVKSVAISLGVLNEDLIKQATELLSPTVPPEERKIVMEALENITGRKLPEDIKSGYINNSSSGAVKLILDKGKCVATEFYVDILNVSADVILEARYQDWVRIIQGKLDASLALLGNTIKIKKGSLSELGKYTNTALIFADVARKINARIEV